MRVASPSIKRMAMTLGGAIVCAVNTACLTPSYPNEPLCCHTPDCGYRFERLDRGENNTDDLFICLTFSGGGTRAAAFAYGVLLGLRDTPIASQVDANRTAPMLDEVDLISSVSGGSFTAMGYGLWRERLFDGRYERRFLERDIQRALVLSLLAPKNLLRIPFILLDRTDVAANYYDQEVFDKATYQDLLNRGERPFIVINATDMQRRQRFAFTQADFDLLGSDLTTLPVGWAVAASSAFPILLSPLRLKYFASDAMTSAVKHVLSQASRGRPDRRRYWAESLLPAETDGSSDEVVIDAKNHKFLYLLDGGLADNLGLTHVIESFRVGPIGRLIAAGRIKRFVLIIVDAATDPPDNLEAFPAAPGLFRMFERTGTTGIHNHSTALWAMARFSLLEAIPKTCDAYRKCQQTLERHCPDAPQVQPDDECGFEPYVIHLNFRDIRDRKKRQTLLSMVTSFFLPSEDVQALIEAGQSLLRKDPEFQRLLNDLSAAPRAQHVGNKVSSTGPQLRIRR